MKSSRVLHAVLAFSLMAALGLAVSPAEAQTPTRIAVVDTQRAIMETEEGLRAQASLKKLFDNRQRELEKKQDDLQKERDDIEKQKDVVSKAALAKRVDKWQREMVQLQQVFVEYNKELQRKQNEMTQPILQKVLGLIRRVATQEGYDVVVDKQTVAYVRTDLDVTDKVIQLYNQGVAPESDAKAPTKAAPAIPTLKPPATPAPPIAPAPAPAPRP